MRYQYSTAKEGSSPCPFETTETQYRGIRVEGSRDTVVTICCATISGRKRKGGPKPSRLIVTGLYETRNDDGQFSGHEHVYKLRKDILSIDT